MIDTKDLRATAEAARPDNGYVRPADRYAFDGAFGPDGVISLLDAIDELRAERDALELLTNSYRTASSA